MENENPENLTDEFIPKEPVGKRNLKWWIIVVACLAAILGGGNLWSILSQEGGGGAANIIGEGNQQGGNINKTSEANNYFGINLIQQLPSDKNGNIFISPLSISQALSLTVNGADGSTLDEMKKILGLSNLTMEAVNNGSEKLLQAIALREKQGEEDQPIFRIANSLWIDKKVEFLPGFLEIASGSFQAKAEALDFDDKKSIDKINSWVSDKTEGKIEKILEILQSDLYLVNAIYFKGSWQEQFDKKLTKEEKFSTKSGAKDVDMMENSGDYDYLEKDGLQIISLPYKGNDYSMKVFLPAKNNSIDEFVKNLTWEEYEKHIEEMKNREGTIKLPKLKIEFGGDILETLEALGLKIAISDAADFSKMANNSLAINEVIHKTYIDVDETGTEAAAATAVGMRVTAIPDNQDKPFKMIVDRPFYFTIQDNETKTIIFEGIVREPTV